MELVLKLSKEQGRLHVVFTSSDSFFQIWIQDQGMLCYFLFRNLEILNAEDTDEL